MSIFWNYIFFISVFIFIAFSISNVIFLSAIHNLYQVKQVLEKKYKIINENHENILKLKLNNMFLNHILLSYYVYGLNVRASAAATINILNYCQLHPMDLPHSKATSLPLKYCNLHKEQEVSNFNLYSKLSCHRLL